jgi:hypothetical protein
LSSAEHHPAQAGAASRVAELESQLASERAESVRRMREVEKRIGEFRDTVKTLREDARQAAADRARAETARQSGAADAAALRAEVETARASIARLESELQAARGVAADAAAVSRAEAEAARAAVARLESELAQARSGEPGAEAALRADAESARAAVARLESELAQVRLGGADAAAALSAETDAARADVARLEGELAAAHAEAARAAALAVRVEELEGALAAAHTVPAPAGTPAAVAADPVYEGFPDVVGLRREGSGETTPYGVRFHARRTSDRLPVDVLVVSQTERPEAAARLSSLPLARHANLVSAVASGAAGTSAYVVLERAAGESVDRIVGRDGTMDELTALRIARQVAQGLRHAAVHDLLHGNLSPAAVRLGANDAAQVEDVGLGPMLPQGERPLTDARFAAPERLSRANAYDHRADIYSLGATLVYLLTATPPYDGDREAVQCAQAVGRTCDLRARRHDVSRDTTVLVGSLLALDPADRPQDWDAALGAIERVLARLGGEPDAGSWFDRLTSAIVSRPALACTLAVTPVVLAGVALHLATNEKPAAGEAPSSAHAAPSRDR